jgi:hypothetical protein
MPQSLVDSRTYALRRMSSFCLRERAHAHLSRVCRDTCAYACRRNRTHTNDYIEIYMHACIFTCMHVCKQLGASRLRGSMHMLQNAHMHPHMFGPTHTYHAYATDTLNVIAYMQEDAPGLHEARVEPTFCRQQRIKGCSPRVRAPLARKLRLGYPILTHTRIARGLISSAWQLIEEEARGTR